MSAYLGLLDELLARGLESALRALLDRQARFIERLQCADGGFTGRQGGSDLYYTDFAVRVLMLCAPTSPALGCIPAFLAEQPPPRNYLEAFSQLNCARLLRLPLPTFSLEALPMPIGAYRTFLAALCYELLGIPFPNIADTVGALRALRCADGGYAERPGAVDGQTNATAAILGTLMLWERMDAVDLPAITAFLAGMQAEDGGLRAHAGIRDGDLLSTYTGLLTLSGIDGVTRIRLADIARFTQRLLAPDGGCCGTRSDSEPDAEYTYYGLGTLALLYGHLNAMAQTGK